MNKSKHTLGKVLISLFAVFCAIAALICGALGLDAGSALAVAMQAPFLLVSLPMMFLSEYSIAAVFVETAIVFLAVLIHPAVMMIRRRKFMRRFFLWLVLDVLACINLFTSWYFSAAAGFALIFYLMLILCLLAECNASLKEDGKKSFKYIVIILYLLAYNAVLYACFQELCNAVYGMVGGAPGDIVGGLFIFLMALCGLIITLFIIFRSLEAVRLFRDDMYDPRMISSLNNINRLCKLNIVFSIVSVMVTIFVLFIASFMGGTLTYSFDFSLLSLLTVCLVIVFVGMLKRAIAEHEENKLTI